MKLLHDFIASKFTFSVLDPLKMSGKCIKMTIFGLSGSVRSLDCATEGELHLRSIPHVYELSYYCSLEQWSRSKPGETHRAEKHKVDLQNTTITACQFQLILLFHYLSTATLGLYGMLLLAVCSLYEGP